MWCCPISSTAARFPIACFASRKASRFLCTRAGRQLDYRARTLLGDAAHPMVQYTRPRRGMALEDAICLRQHRRRMDGDLRARSALQDIRIVRTARVQISLDDDEQATTPRASSGMCAIRCSRPHSGGIYDAGVALQPRRPTSIVAYRENQDFQLFFASSGKGTTAFRLAIGPAARNDVSRCSAKGSTEMTAALAPIDAGLQSAASALKLPRHRSRPWPKTATFGGSSASVPREQTAPDNDRNIVDRKITRK